jgi:hypothetical protein
VKQLEIFFRIFLAVFFLLTASAIQASGQNSNKMDSIEIGLITCTPHEEVYSLYGHTALRYHNQRTGQDLVFNYGVFNFKAPNFVARFVLGKTDYELGVIPLEPFCKYYKDWGSAVVEQVLNLTDEEKENIAIALTINLRPENRIYRYNFFYDNCSTRPRDIIENNIFGKIVYQEENLGLSYRKMIHELNAHHPWAAFGNDLLLGVKADMKTSLREQEFLPLNLMHDFDQAKIYSNGDYRPLVKERRTLIKPGIQIVEEEFPLSPTFCALLLLSIVFIVSVFEWKRKRCEVYFDAFLMLTIGTVGLLLLIMFFSEHPTTSTNLQILLFNPLSLVFIPAIIKRRKTSYWNILLICLIMFFLGGIFQDYAEGLEIVALSLLIRIWIHKINDK